MIFLAFAILAVLSVIAEFSIDGSRIEHKWKTITRIFINWMLIAWGTIELYEKIHR
ncbi:MAG: hypothetical protein IKK97_02285 [Phascolarctobacterium sp.]|nr:hypothetical protein [Phascolarctobacterium sp.]